MSGGQVSLVRSGELTEVAPYAYASLVPAGAAVVFTAGACPLDADGNTLRVGDVAGQAAVTMDNLVTALEAAGATLADVAKTTVFVASSDRSDLVTAFNVVRARFGDHDAPSTLLGVAMLGYPDQLVEVEAVAAVSA